MYNKTHIKNQEILEKLKNDGYCVSRIEKDKRLLYVAVEVDNRNIIIDYNTGFYEMGEIYGYTTENVNTVLYAYGFKQYRKEVIENYLLYVKPESDFWYIDKTTDKDALMHWLKENKLTIKT